MVIVFTLVDRRGAAAHFLTVSATVVVSILGKFLGSELFIFINRFSGEWAFYLPCSGNKTKRGGELRSVLTPSLYLFKISDIHTRKNVLYILKRSWPICVFDLNPDSWKRIYFNSQFHMDFEWRNSTLCCASTPERRIKNIKYFLASNENRTHNLSRL